jgi:hypothetical protein
LERTVYRSRWRDGLLDLLGGLGVLILGWSWGAGNPWIGFLSVPILVSAWKPLRVAVVEPRIGRARFAGGWKQRESDGTRGTAVFGMGIVTFFLAHHVLSARAADLGADWFGVWVESLPSATLVLLTLATAMILDLRRFLFYAIVVLGAGSVGERIGADPATQILMAGTVISFIGLILFTHLLLTHPYPKRAVGDA